VATGTQESGHDLSWETQRNANMQLATLFVKYFPGYMFPAAS
jgi:hypothetical protein